jgi:NAD(P)-dependent dehydrogenase (short-subunit alcohol dehydrogenase family)
VQLRLDGKVAVLTSASRGIGATFADVVARIVLAARDGHGLAELAESLPAGTVEIFPANAGNPEDAEDCVAAALSRFGKLDIVVNNAATNPYFGPAMDIDLPRFDKMVQVNLRGPLVWTQAAWRATSMAGSLGDLTDRIAELPLRTAWRHR